MVPVDVSLCTIVTASNSPLDSFSFRLSARIGEPQATRNPSASLPQRRATSSHLSENAPHMQQSTLRVVKLRIAASITPQADEVLT